MGGTILLADDSLTIQKVVELTFSDTDFTVMAVSTGDELLQRLPSARPDVIICDVIMPGRDGYDVCQQIKSNPATLQIPVVLLTGTFEPFDRDRALAAGCSEIISKPFEARKLVETVERLVQQSQGAQPTDFPPPQVEGAVRPPTVDRPAFGAPPTPEVAPPAWPSPPPEQFAEPPIDDLGEVEAGTLDEIQPEGEEALDFTASGFAEMEAAGRQANVEGMEAPREGLDFEHHALPEDAPESEEAAVRESPWADRTWDEQESAATEPPDDSWIERLEETPEPVAEEPTGETGAEPFGELEGVVLQPWQETPPDEAPLPAESMPVAEAAAPEQEVEPLSGDVTPSEPFSADAGTEEEAPFRTMPMARLGDLVEAATRMEEEAPVEEPAPGVFDQAPVEADEEPVGVVAETPLPGVEEPAEPTPEAEPAPESRADTQPSVVVPAPTAHLRLSDEDVERVAQRVLELARGLIEQIAWDVVPDMAEIVVRERVREIEAEADREQDESPQ